MLIFARHPSLAFFHNPYERGNFEVDLDRFSRLIKGKLEAPPVRLNINPKARHVRELVREAARLGEPLSCDIESLPERGDYEGYTAKDPGRARLHLLGFGVTTQALCIEWGNGTSPVEREAAKILANPKITKVFQNGWFYDIPILRRYGLCVK